jgi:tRNA isopentenyl-2-thiomethyl-A-37 hydroxylase MiaE
MKKDLIIEFVELQKEELKQLCSIVKETLATNITLPAVKASRKSYGINDLWSLRRNMKTAERRWNSRARNFYVRG